MARRKITRDTACDILSSLDIRHGTDFHALRSDKVNGLLDAARRVGYRKSKNASGSRGRMFYYYLQRTCR